MKNLFLISILFTLFFQSIYSQAKSARVVLFECFTSTTCPPCATADQYFDSWLENSLSDPSKLAVLEYHVWWPAPGNDPFYLSNPIDSQNRNSYYNNNYAPHTFIDGKDANWDYSLWPTFIGNETSISSPLQINISGGQVSSNYSLTINVKSDSSALPSGTLVLYTAVTESNLQYTGPNGYPVHNNVMRKMYPSSEGETFSLNTGESKTFNQTIPWDSSWTAANSKIICFVQIKESYEILQAAWIDVSTITDVQNKSQLEIPKEFELSQNYPNPFNPTTIINYTVPKKSLVTIKVYDILGWEIKMLVNEEKVAGNYSVQFNGTGLSSGIYFYKISAGAYTETKKMVLLK